MKKTLQSTFAILLLTATAHAYDATKAKELNAFYSHMTQKACADSKLFVKAKDVMKMLQEKKPFTMLDVRTDGESEIISLSGELAAIGLKRVGFKKIHVIKGGLVALAEANNPKNAPIK